jgi:serine/threonine-protein kinase RsbW
VELLKSRGIYSTCVPSSINSIAIIVNELIQSLQSSYGSVNECTLFELRVILNEVLVNAVRHGNREDERKIVKVDAGISGQGIMFIIVEDEGSGYDFKDTCSCSKPFCGMTDPLEVSESGRGIMIIRSLCDNVKVNARGNKIIIAKSIAKP